MNTSDFGTIYQTIIGRPRYRQSYFGAAFYDLDDGKVLYEHKADGIFLGASTTKLPTVATALAVLGPEFRFQTVVKHTGHIADGTTLEGDLVLVAAGDPNLSGRITAEDTLAFTNPDHALATAGESPVLGDPLFVMRKLARAIADTGITRITGRVCVDVSLFPEAIVVNDNLIDLTARGGSAAGESISIAVWPATSYVTFVCEAITGGSELALTLSHDDIDESSEKQRVRISGTLPVGISSHCPVVVRSPRAFARTVFVEMLAECGISLEGALLGPSLYTDGAAALAPDVLAEHLSPPFSEAAKVILKVSQNLHAELCPRIIGATVDGVRGADAAEAGYGHIRRFLSEQGLAADGIVQGDASGAEGYFTPHFMCRLLLAIAHHPIGSALRFGLPVLGRDGTLSSIIPDSAAAGHVVAKTGTIAITDRVHKRIFVGAKGLAGYIHAASGRHIAFTVYVNNVVLEPGESYDLVGEMLGNIAAAAYETM